jgi:hypothetical protein
MEAVKILEVQPRGTPRRKRARNVQIVTAGTGETLPGRNVLRIAWTTRPITGVEPGNGSSAGRESEAAIVLIEPCGQHNRR